jgi:TP901 family phage tail tape measure protein
MADIESNINIDINTSNALASLRLLQREISNFQQVMSKTGALSSAQLGNMQQNLINGINSTGNFNATMQRVTTTTESFTNSLEKNKFSMGQYFRYSAGATKTFGKAFRTEFDTIEKVARERVKTLQTQYIKMGRDGSGAMNAIAVRPLTLDMNDLGTKTAIAAQKQQLFTQLMKQGSTELLNFGKNTQWAGRQLMVGFTIPLGIMGAAAAREFKAIEEQVLRLERVYGDFTTTMADTEKMTSQIKELATEFTKYGLSVAKTVGLAADAAAMGSVGADLVAQVREASRLAVLGGVEQQQALETTISLTSAFGVATEELANKTDFLNAVENQTITSIEDLTEAIPKAGPVVQQLGGDVEDLTFFLTAMREGGINASESANALKSGLASLINPTGEAAEMLNGFGINLNGIVEANKGDVKGIVVDFAKALDTLDPLNRAQAIEQLFGKFQFSRLSTLFQNVIKEGSQAQRVLELTNSSAAELSMLSQRELGKIEASSLYQFQGAIEEFKAALAPVGETFMQVVTPIIKFGTDILNKFNEMDAGAKQFLVTLVGAVAGIGPVFLMTFGLIANGIANMIKGFMFVRNTLTGVGRSTDILAEQTSYMTTEQLKAQAVASSLGQVHTKLTQTFNAEAAAVRSLAGAYGQAIAAQAQFTGPVVAGGRGAKPKKFASGGLVPGSGNSDTVAALLTPGEFVLRKDVVQQYPGTIAAMMNGRLQKFNKGGLVQAHLQTALNVNDSDIMSQMVARYPGFAQLSPEQQGMYQVSGSLTADVGRKLNEALKRVGPDGVQGLIADDFTSAWNAVQNKLGTAASQAGVGQYTNIIAKIEDSIGKEAVKLAGAGGKVSDQILAQATENVLNRNIKAGGESRIVASALKDRGRVLGDVRSAPGKVSSAQLKAGLANGSLVMGPDNHIYYADKNGQPIPGSPPVGRNSQSAGPKQSTKHVPGGYRSSKTSAKIVDPKSAMLGVSLSGPVEEENRKAKKENTRATRKNTETVKKATKQEGQMLKDAKKSEAAKRGWETRRAKLAEAEMASKPNRFGGMSGKLGMMGMAAGGALSGISMLGGPAGEIAGAIAGPAFAAGGVLQVLQMFPNVLSKIPGPVGLVAAGVAALGVGLYAMHEQLQATRKSAKEAAEAVSVGRTAMEGYAEATGKITASQELQQRRRDSLIPQAAGDEAGFGSAYLESEAGKAMKTGIQKALEDVGAGPTAKNFGQQLATAVTTNLLSFQEAAQVAAAMGEALGSESLSVQMVAQLESLIGKNGEDITKNPLQVKVNLIEESRESLQNTLKTITGTGFAWWGSEDWNDMVAAEQEFGVQFASTKEQGQLLLDNLQLQHEARLESLQAAGDLVGVQEELKKYETDRLALQKEVTKSSRQAIDAFNKLDGANRGAVLNATSKSLQEQYAGTDQEAAAKAATDRIMKENPTGTRQITNETRMVLMTDIKAGTISPEEFNQLVDFMKPENGNVKTYDTIAKISTEVGGEAASILTTLIPKLGTEEAARKVIAAIDVENPEAAGKLIAAYEKIEQLAGQGGIDLIINAAEGSTAAQAALDNLASKYLEIDSLFASGGPLTMETLVQLDPNFNLLFAQADWFNSLPPTDQKTFVQKVLTVVATVSDAQALQELKRSNTKPQGPVRSGGLRGNVETTGYSFEQIQAAKYRVAGTMAQQYVQAYPARPLNNNPPSSPPATQASGGGGGGAGSQPSLPTEEERYQASLNLIADQEEAINKSYDKRLEALDEIQKAQEAISNQQRDQLDLADALTKGDIASAARAMRSMRENEARRAAEAQRVALEKARERELSQVTYGGLTRAQLEARLAAIESAENARVAAGQPRANGGYISGPGTGTSDSIPAMLSNGEYVIRAAAVKALGVDKLNMLNMADKFAMGGFAGNRSALLNARKSAKFSTASLSAPSYGISAGMAPMSMAGAGVAGSSAPANTDNSVYNYNINVNASTNANPDQIASVVVRQIQDLESRRVRRNYVSG